MKIVIDLQGAQSTGSRNRGIGRYSIAISKALIQVARERGHEVFVACNNAFPLAIEPLKAAFLPLVSKEQFVVWDGPVKAGYQNETTKWISRAGERLRDHYLQRLDPDFILTTSLCEGFGDPVVVSGAPRAGRALSAVILYDLIPVIYKDIYLPHVETRQFFYRRLGQMQQADLLLAISAASRSDAIARLGVDPERVVNISGAVDDIFRRIDISSEDAARLLSRYGLKSDFIMYTGGIDFRKNTDGLIEGFSQLPQAFRQAHPLAIVCKADKDARKRLEDLAARHGIGQGEIVITGFVPDQDLVEFYNLCALFIFPSLYEGFGLPVLEAMSCGAPTASGDNSSLVEINQLKGASFDASSPSAIARTIKDCIDTPGRLEELRAYSLARAQDFSWLNCARVSLDGMERILADRGRAAPVAGRRRKRLAFISPLPPLASGIADHSAALVNALAKDFDIDLVVAQDEISDEWLIANHRVMSYKALSDPWRHYDHLVFHFGNSRFHQHMLPMLEEFGGVVVMHDFFMSGMMCDGEYVGQLPQFWTKRLLHAHGYAALAAKTRDPHDATWLYPSNLEMLDWADGVITHSAAPKELFATYYGDGMPPWEVIPLFRRTTRATTREEARARLGLNDQTFLVCSFGVMGESKRADGLLEGWLASTLAGDADCRLLFVGTADGPYAQAVVQRIKSESGARNVTVTGYVSPEEYETYLAASDLAVQLRALSRGETSISVLDCFTYAIPTIVNAHGTMAELDPATVLRIPDTFTSGELAGALETLHRDPGERRRLGEAGRAYILAHHGAANVRHRYREALERFATSPRARHRRLAMAIRDQAEEQPPSVEALASMAETLSHGLPPRVGAPLIFVDVTALLADAQGRGMDGLRSLLRAMLLDAREGWRVRPVYFDTAILDYRHAHGFACGLLGIPGEAPFDEVASLRRGDHLLVLASPSHPLEAAPEFLARAANRGIAIALFWHDPESVMKLADPDGAEAVGVGFSPHAASLLIVASERQALVAEQWSKKAEVGRASPPRIRIRHPDEDAQTLFDDVLCRQAS
ncbi:Glycosyltransferase involved in cell wall bisynthesis [Arboricoccus pini]|uniref:Glycosyltransferase involved in cell wall bisynthesis n=1 Tax=Arboricoccus pini TaxID=1963835 RepID=A0A212RDA3_9PROT|nr:glycosyltransferase [Arboricoccus pini]SNB70259.1 Glycosyltransferase involved in cell wall bisynthesis [Arboricoccus pini]